MFIAFYTLSCAQDLLGVAKEKLLHRNQFSPLDSGSISTPLSVPSLLKNTQYHSNFTFAGLRPKGTSASNGQPQQSLLIHRAPVILGEGEGWCEIKYADPTPLTLTPSQERPLSVLQGVLLKQMLEAKKNQGQKLDCSRSSAGEAACLYSTATAGYHSKPHYTYLQLCKQNHLFFRFSQFFIMMEKKITIVLTFSFIQELGSQFLKTCFYFILTQKVYP